MKISLKVFFFAFAALILLVTNSSAAEMPPTWPWHGVSIENDEPFDPSELEQVAKSLRINSIQIRLVPRRFAEIKKLKPEDAWVQSLDWGNKMLDQCKRLGLVAIMTVEGGYPLDPTLPLMSNDDRFWNDPGRMDEAVEVADKLAAFFSKRGGELVAYQMLSEPLTIENEKAASPTHWRSLMERIIAAIRKHDPNRWIAVGLPPGGGPNLYKGFEPFDASRIVYGAHMYIPQAFTHQGILTYENQTNTYPGSIGLQKWDKQALSNIMMPLRDFQLQHGVPVWIGEFGSIVWAKGGEQYLVDLVDIFDKWDWSWTYFSLNGYFGWSPDFDNIKPEPMATWPKHRVGRASLRWQTLSKISGGH